MRVVPISKHDAELFVLNKHYSRRASIFWKGFGLVIDGMIEGVCVYGQPSPPVQRYAFKDRNFRLFELSRLVIQTKKENAASFLVGQSLKMIERPFACVSYADSEHGHSGIVYQATNWIYTGATLSHDHAYVIDGKRVHPITLRDQGITNPKEWAKANGIKTVPPMPKHRYFFISGSSKKQTKEIRKNLRYAIVDKYPKSAKTMYDDGPIVRITCQTLTI